MKTPLWVKQWGLLGLMMLISAASFAAVSSQALNLGTLAGMPVYIPFKLSSAQPVAGVNGQLNFDTTYLESPSIQIGSGADGFITLGNEVSPGHFRFVIYSDPVKSMNLSLPVAYFRLMVKPFTSQVTAFSTTLSFSSGANDIGAGDPNATSLGASFSDIKLSAKNAAQEWSFYE